jgi:hypothetical protein
MKIFISLLILILSCNAFSMFDCVNEGGALLLESGASCQCPNNTIITCNAPEGKNCVANCGGEYIQGVHGENPIDK